MKNRFLAASAIMVACSAIVLASCTGQPPKRAQIPTASPPETAMTTLHATGPFDVKLSPQALTVEDKVEGAALGRMSIDKQFHGDLEATSKGEMLSAMSGTPGSAGYVAIEKVSGTLHGRRGSFVLQHNATMTRGTPAMNIIVVPDSGTDQLAGLSGTMTIVIADGKHSYAFDYVLAPTP